MLIALAALATAIVPLAGGCSESRFSDPGNIDNPYLPLTKVKRCELRGEASDGTKERSVKTVKPFTKRFEVDGKRVEAVVIEDRAYEGGELVESTLDYFAQDDDGTVYYLGEDVTNVKDGEVVDNAGTWLYGRDTDRLGVAMPADPETGDRYRFEDVPGSRRSRTASRRPACGRRSAGRS
jgi:hypothetical protein